MRAVVSRCSRKAREIVGVMMEVESAEHELECVSEACMALNKLMVESGSKASGFAGWTCRTLVTFCFPSLLSPRSGEFALLWFPEPHLTCYMWPVHEFVRKCPREMLSTIDRHSSQGLQYGTCEVSAHLRPPRVPCTAHRENEVRPGDRESSWPHHFTAVDSYANCALLTAVAPAEDERLRKEDGFDRGSLC